MDVASLFNRGVKVDGAPLPATTTTIYGTAVADSADGTVLVELDGDAVTQPAQEETTATIAAGEFVGGTAALPSEPFPGSVVVYAESVADDNVLPESEYQVNGDRITIEALAGGEPVGIEWQTHVQQAVTNADFVGGAVQLEGEPVGLSVTEDVGGAGVADWQPVPFTLDSTTLYVEGMQPADGRVVAEYVRTVSLVTSAGEQVLPDMPAASDVTVTGRTTTATGDPVDATVTGWNLAGDIITIPEGHDTYTITYTMPEREEWNVTGQTDSEPLPDYDPEFDGDAQSGEELAPESVTVGHELTFEPDAGTLAVTVDGEPATFTLDVRTVTVDYAPAATRYLSIEYDATQAMELPAAAFANGPADLPTMPNDGTVAVTVGGAALDPADYSVSDRAVSIPALVADVSQYVVTYAEQVPTAAVELPTFPAVVEGDTVQITVVGGVPTVTAVQGAGDAMQGQVTDATTLAVDASTAADAAQTAAEAAQEIAEATGQHVWDYTDGLHVTQAEKDAFLATPQGRNILMNALGILIRDALQYRTVVHDEGLTVYDGQGNAATNVVANILRDLITLGYADESHAEIDYHSLQLVDKEGSTYFHVSDLRNASGQVTVTYEGDGSTTAYVVPFGSYTFDANAVEVDDAVVAFTKSGDPFVLATAPAAGSTVTITVSPDRGDTTAYTLGYRADAVIGAMSVAEGYATEASGYATHAEGYETVASGLESHAEGHSTTASGSYAHAEGERTTASGGAAHAEGDGNTASGWATHAEGVGTQATYQAAHAEGQFVTASALAAHAEGDTTTASGAGAHAEGGYSTASAAYAHAEGGQTTASGADAHAEGYDATASGSASHAQNTGTKASSANQTALGAYNVEDGAGTYAVIIGNGTSNTARSNALTVDWDGHVDAGRIVDLHVDSTNGADYDTRLVAASDGTNFSVFVRDPANTNEVTQFYLFGGAAGAKGRIMQRTSTDGGTTWRAQHGVRSPWTSLGSFTGTGNLSYSLTEYEEVMYAAKANGKLVTATVAKQLLTSSAQELWLGGGKSATNVANGGNLRAVINVSLTGCRGVNFSEGSTDRTSSTTWNVYAR